MTGLHQLATPAAVIDLNRLEANTRRMADRAHELGVQLRPHVKTHKTLEAMAYQIRDHFGGITVSTLAEAEFYGSRGVQDITYAVPITPHKVPRALKLAQSIEHLNVLVDHQDAVVALSQGCASQRQRLAVLIKVDCGYGRAGLTPDDPELPKLAQQLAADPWLDFAGVLTHAGHSYHCANLDEIREVAREEHSAIIKARDVLTKEGLEVPTVSLGSTPTAVAFETLTGVTELRPGNYALFDLFQASIGSCQLGDVALSVITEVIACYPKRGELLLDAGALALSKDIGASSAAQPRFGVICDLSCRPLPQLELVGLSQEHGKVKVGAGFDLSQLSVGDRLRVLPNHSCLVTALYDQLHVAQGEVVVDRWRPVRGW